MNDYYEINTDGVRPNWLADTDRMISWSSDGSRFVYSTGPVGQYKSHEWPLFKVIRMPRSHWAISVLEQGWKPWPGGESSPPDWDGGEVLWADGETDEAGGGNLPWVSEGWENSNLRIIGYHSKPTPSEHPEYSPELWDRVVVHLHKSRCIDAGDDFERQDILSELDKSKEVDPLLSEAQEIVEKASRDMVTPCREVRDERLFEHIYAALQRGMELAKEVG